MAQSPEHFEKQLSELLENRGKDGWIRECHGDIHLGNITVIDGQVGVLGSGTDIDDNSTVSIDIDEHQIVIGKVIEQAERPFTCFTSIEVARVILNS